MHGKVSMLYNCKALKEGNHFYAIVSLVRIQHKKWKHGILKFHSPPTYTPTQGSTRSFAHLCA